MTQTTAQRPPVRPDSLEGQLLIAMPMMGDPNFSRSVIYMCAHSNEGAMGLIINRYTPDITFAGLLEQIDLAGGQDTNSDDDTNETADETDTEPLPPALAARPVHLGGPVETNRGFVLHSDDYADDDTSLRVRDGICLTATIDVLRALIEGRGPSRSLVALGYAGWSPGQLESEIQANGWLHVQADHSLIFDTPAEEKYDDALARLGIDPARLSGEAGHA